MERECFLAAECIISYDESAVDRLSERGGDRGKFVVVRNTAPRIEPARDAAGTLIAERNEGSTLGYVGMFDVMKDILGLDPDLLQLAEVGDGRSHVDLRRRLRRLDVPADVEVEVVLLDLVEAESVLAAGTHGSTFGGTPFVCSVALATVQTIIEEKIPDRVARTSRYLMDGLAGLKAKPVTAIRGRGFLIGVELTGLAGPVVDACRDAGLLVLSAGDKVHRLAPPLIATERDCDRALEIIGAALGRLVT
jgi:hypothetical protein